MKYISMDVDERIHGYELFYSSLENIMYDECGFVIFSIIDPNTLFLFKKNKRNMSTHTKDGIPVRLYYTL